MQDGDNFFAEQLEARRLLAADASVNITGASQSLLGEEVNFVVTFDNASTDLTDNVGYSPFVDIVMPATGDAPPLPDTYLIFKRRAMYNGMNLKTTVITFDANGEVIHPLQKMLLENRSSFRAIAGDELVVVELPFGSYGPSQPPIDINFKGQSVHWPSLRNPTTSQQQEDIDTNLTQVGIQLSTTQTLAPPLMIRYSHSFFD